MRFRQFVRATGLACVLVPGALGCKRSVPPPNVTGAFGASALTLTYVRPPGGSTVGPRTEGNRRVTVTLSDEKPDSTAVRLEYNDFMLSPTRCEGRASRFDKDDGTSRYAVPALTCRIVTSDGTPSSLFAGCSIQSGVVGFRWERASGSITTENALALRYQPTGEQTCGWMVEAQLPLNTAMTPTTVASAN